MQGRRVTILVAALGVILLPPALANEGPGLGDLDCQVDAPKCAENPPADPLGGALGDVVAAAPDEAPEKPGLLAQVGAMLGNAAGAIGDAAGQAAAFLGAAAGAIGAAFLNALRPLAEWIIGYKPAQMPVPAYAGIAAGGTAVAAAGSQLGLWWLARKVAPWLALVPGFSRIAKDELLDHGSRARIFEMIRHSPGVRLGEIARGLDMPWGSTMHHLRKLRSERLILFKEIGRHKCYFINGSGLNEHEMKAASFLKGDTLTEVAGFIQANPRTSLKELAEGLGISSPLAAFHVSKLERAGMIQKVRDGRTVRLHFAGPASTPAAAPSISPLLAAPTPAAL